MNFAVVSCCSTLRSVLVLLHLHRQLRANIITVSGLKRMNIYIRADANHNIGMGHIMRTLSIADAFSNFGHCVRFILADDGITSLIHKRGYECHILHSDYQNMETELSLWPENTPDIIIVDSYFVTETYLSLLQEKMRSVGGKLIYIDDVYTFPYPVDILVDYNAYGESVDYEGLYSNHKMPSLILGPTYAPLRSMFRGLEKKIQPETVNSILISTGGSDELHLTMTLIKGLKNGRADSSRVYHFLLGAMNTDKDEIYELAEGNDHIVLHENVADMKSLITSCDLAISAAGSTLYEICACGVPLITYSLADNQVLGAEALSSLELAINIGDLRDPNTIDPNTVMSGSLSSDVEERIMDAAEKLADDHEKRVSMGIRMQEFIDGFGADRMVQKII